MKYIDIQEGVPAIRQNQVQYIFMFMGWRGLLNFTVLLYQW